MTSIKNFSISISFPLPLPLSSSKLKEASSNITERRYVASRYFAVLRSVTMSRDCDARTFENRNIGREARRGASAGDAQGSSYTCEPHVTKGKVGKGRESERERERERETKRDGERGCTFLLLERTTSTYVIR